MWRLNNMLLSRKWVTEEIKGEIKKNPETNENKYNLPKYTDAARPVLSGKFTFIQHTI